MGSFQIFILSFWSPVEQLHTLNHPQNQLAVHKTAHLALCSQPPTKCDALLDLPHVWKRDKREFHREEPTSCLGGVAIHFGTQ